MDFLGNPPTVELAWLSATFWLVLGMTLWIFFGIQKRADTLLKELKTEESKFRLAVASLEDAVSRNEKLLSLLDRIQKDQRDWRCQCEDEAEDCSSCLLMQEAREEVSKEWNEFHRQERRGR